MVFSYIYKLLGIGCYDLSVCYFLILLFLVFLIVVVVVTQIQKFIHSYKKYLLMQDGNTLSMKVSTEGIKTVKNV